MFRKRVQGAFRSFSCITTRLLKTEIRKERVDFLTPKEHKKGRARRLIKKRMCTVPIHAPKSFTKIPTIYRLVVVRLVRIRQIKDDRAMRPRATSLWELAEEVDAAVEAQAAVRENIDPLRLEVGRRVNDTNAARLHEVVGDKQVLLIRADLDVVGSDDALVLIRVIETLDVVQVTDVERSNVVSDREREVSELAIVSDVGVDGEIVACAWAEIVEQLCDTLLTLSVLAERVDDPDLAGADGGGERGGLGVAWDELYVLDTLAVGDGDGADDFARAELPQA